MLITKTIVVKFKDRGKIISLQDVHKFSLFMKPGESGFTYSPKRTMLCQFDVTKDMQYIRLFPGRGGQPGKCGHRSYVEIMPHRIESIDSMDGSGEPIDGKDGYIIVRLLMNLQPEPCD